MIIKKIIALSSVSLIATLALVAVSVNAQTLDTTGTASSTTGTSVSTPATTNTTSTTGTTDAGAMTTPGLPNTGVGGEAATNFAILISSGLIALGGIAFLARRVSQAR